MLRTRLVSYTVSFELQEAEQTVYRNIARPRDAADWTATTDWTNWAIAEKILLPVTPRLPATCVYCYGAVGYGFNYNEDTPWPYCYHCNHYDWDGISFTPIGYSIDAGLESLLHRYKDWANYAWAGFGLGSTLADFLITHGHKQCVEAGGKLDLATAVPSGNDQRSWKPLEGVVNSVSGWKTDWWDFAAIRKVKLGRPDRGQCDPDFYEVDQNAVRGRRVLLLDDTWTSGASTMSAAWALRGAGARHVSIVTLGRQLNRHGIGSSAELFAAAEARSFDMRECVACG